jgi:hypothetical protein
MCTNLDTRASSLRALTEQPFTGGDLTVFPFDPLEESFGDDADFKTKFIPLHPASAGSPVYAASFNAPDRIALQPVKSGARVLLV